MASPRSDASPSWQAAVSNEDRTALVTELCVFLPSSCAAVV